MYRHSNSLFEHFPPIALLSQPPHSLTLTDISHQHVYSSPAFNLNPQAKALIQPNSTPKALFYNYSRHDAFSSPRVSDDKVNLRHHANFICAELLTTTLISSSTSIRDSEVYACIQYVLHCLFPVPLLVDPHTWCLPNHGSRFPWYFSDVTLISALFSLTECKP